MNFPRRTHRALAFSLAMAMLLSLWTVVPAAAADEYPNRLNSMNCSDPYILAYEPTQTYYFYTAGRVGSNPSGVIAYKSKDLKNWSAAIQVYTVPTGEGYWNLSTSPWAPEVHEYKGKYYLITTLHNRNTVIATAYHKTGWPGTQACGDCNQVWQNQYARASIIAVADTPEGPFINLKKDAPVTDPSFMTLDGTLYVDPDGKPWMVYAHEWIQKIDGTIEAVPLLDDLSDADPSRKSISLFKASDAPWYSDPIYGAPTKPTGYNANNVLQKMNYIQAYQDFNNLQGLVNNEQLPPYVTDGPHLHRTPDGSLVCLWTSYRMHNEEYVETQAISRTGNIEGPWEQLPVLIDHNRGHAMVFTTFEGQKMMVLHKNMNNIGGSRRAELYDVELTNDGFKILSHRFDLDGSAEGDTDYAFNNAPNLYPPETKIVETTAEFAPVSFKAKAYDAEDGWLDVTYSHQPGSAFPKGTTAVTVTAADAEGGVTTKTFNVIVRDPVEKPSVAPRSRLDLEKALGLRNAEGEGTSLVFNLRLPSMGVHDPYIVADEALGLYFLYTAGNGGTSGNGVMAYISEDLQNWSKAYPVFKVPRSSDVDSEGNPMVAPWNATSAPWAPEVHFYQGKYYMFTTLHNSTINLGKADPANPYLQGVGDNGLSWQDKTARASVIAVSDKPEGPFKVVDRTKPVVDISLMTLDSTLYVDPDGNPWIVFANEWVQRIDGTIAAAPLKSDLSGIVDGVTVEDYTHLFKASDAPWYSQDVYGAPINSNDGYNYQDVYNAMDGTGTKTLAEITQTLVNKNQIGPMVTDGPHLHKTPNGSLVMVWTSYRMKNQEYVETQAISRTGSIQGPWEQLEPIITHNKGHAMVFKPLAGFGGGTFDGNFRYLMILHRNMNSIGGSPRGEIYEVELTDDGFKVLAHRQDLDDTAVDLADKYAPKLYLPSTRVVKVTDTAGTPVSFTAKAYDNEDGWLDVTYSVNPGGLFPIGDTQVTATATDGAGNSSTGTFTVRVLNDYAVTLTPACKNLVAGLNANIVASVSGASEGDELFAALYYGGARVSDPAPVVNGAVRFAAAVPDVAGVAMKIGLFKAGQDPVAYDSIVLHHPVGLWTPVMTGQDGTIQIAFTETISLSPGKAKAMVNGVGKDLTVNVDNRSLTVASPLAEGDVVVVSGVKYPVLFPSYSFTFTLKNS